VFPWQKAKSDMKTLLKWLSDQVKDVMWPGVPSADTAVTAGSTIAVSTGVNELRIYGSGGAVTMTATPTLQTSSVEDGRAITLFGTNSSNPVTLQSEGDLTGSALLMQGDLPFTLGENDNITFKFRASTSMWREIARADLPDTPV